MRVFCLANFKIETMRATEVRRTSPSGIMPTANAPEVITILPQVAASERDKEDPKTSGFPPWIVILIHKVVMITATTTRIAYARKRMILLMMVINSL